MSSQLYYWASLPIARGELSEILWQRVENECIEKCAPCRIRTYDLLLKREQLYQLS